METSIKIWWKKRILSLSTHLSLCLLCVLSHWEINYIQNVPVFVCQLDSYCCWIVSNICILLTWSLSYFLFPYYQDHYIATYFKSKWHNSCLVFHNSCVFYNNFMVFMWCNHCLKSLSSCVCVYYTREKLRGNIF